MNDVEIATHAGKTQAIANMCVALVVAHPMPAEVQRMFEKLCLQTLAQASQFPNSEAYKSGIASIAKLLSEATKIAQGVDLLHALPAQHGH